ncbi:MAG: type III secretion protein [Proteobacteria bacterium]|uniref:Type III secretion protein n=1 Tax=Candidatus Avisuccinivibrio stercorigallinarum TaxID=2840704 RepID=A0A9D9GUW7_9GAMM|nr:type III secretion protein [Candidatus Avisuccinivibrio stercorigallinarum]
MDINTGGLSNLIGQGLDSLSTRAENLKTRMGEVANMEAEDQTAAMIELQFEMGQYNTMVELTSSITKSLSDSVKSISQKV